MKFVIMAGGAGSKLWPISRLKAPKQFIKIVGERTLFQLTVDSLLLKYKVEDIFVCLTEDLVHYVKEQTPNIPEENYIVEPMARDTGPASCCAMAKVAEKYPNEVVYFYVQCVCTREPAEKFMEMIAEMERQVRDTGKLITGTIVPKYVETGSDLFKMGATQVTASGLKVHEVEEFINVVKERMTAEQVTEISNKYVVGTHTNHYTWRPKEFFEAIKLHRPDWYGVLEELRGVFDKENEKEKISEIYTKFEKGRIEVVTTELIKEGKVKAIELPFNWAHITTWDDVYRYREQNNIPTIEGEVVEVESEGNLVICRGNKLISLIGMKEMVVVETDDAIFISPREQSSKIKAVMDILQEEKKDLV